MCIVGAEGWLRIFIFQRRSSCLPWLHIPAACACLVSLRVSLRCVRGWVLEMSWHTLSLDTAPSSAHVVRRACGGIQFSLEDVGGLAAAAIEPVEPVSIHAIGQVIPWVSDGRVELRLCQYLLGLSLRTNRDSPQTRVRLAELAAEL